jgi:hypothetical protein
MALPTQAVATISATVLADLFRPLAASRIERLTFAKLPLNTRVDAMLRSFCGAQCGSAVA